jgi:hypothetical protein
MAGPVSIHDVSYARNLPVNSIRLSRVEIRQLPLVCMRCGEPAVDYHAKEFVYQRPDKVVPLGFFIEILANAHLEKKATVAIPLCVHHERRCGMTIHELLIIGFFAFLGVAVIGSIILYRIGPFEFNERAPWLLIPTGVAAAAYLIVATVIGRGAIDVVEITDESITLKGVAKGFVKAVEEVRKGPARH